jgi:hypothetical protein
MPRVGLEPTIPAFERTKTVHALDRAATVIAIACQTKVYIYQAAGEYPENVNNAVADDKEHFWTV